jgi:hypothetical protein
MVLVSANVAHPTVTLYNRHAAGVVAVPWTRREDDFVHRFGSSVYDQDVKAQPGVGQLPETSRDARVARKLSRGPLITLTCDCGERRELHYGERWRCDGCGRTWDTNQIPADEYAAILRTQVRFRLFPIVSGLAVLGAIAGFILAGRAFGAILVVPFLAMAYNLFMRPLHRRRYRRALAKQNLPTWNIKPE